MLRSARLLGHEQHPLEEGTAFRLPLKVGHGPWLEKLGGGPCYIGSDENPIHINLTTEGSGAAGNCTSTKNSPQIELLETAGLWIRMENRSSSVPKGCGGAYETVRRRVARIWRSRSEFRE